MKFLETLLLLVILFVQGYGCFFLIKLTTFLKFYLHLVLYFGFKFLLSIKSQSTLSSKNWL